MEKPLNYYGYAFDEKFKDDSRQERWKKERKELGFDSSELYNLDQTIAQFIYPRLKGFRDGELGWPSSMEKEEWYAILDCMIFAFEKIIEEETGEFKLMEEETRKKVRKGLKYFAKYFKSLWF